LTLTYNFFHPERKVIIARGKKEKKKGEKRERKGKNGTRMWARKVQKFYSHVSGQNQKIRTKKGKGRGKKGEKTRDEWSCHVES